MGAARHADVQRIRARTTKLGLAPLAVAALVACGPSFQVIYEGNARFEHCYALEENPQTAMHDKATCWRDWSERYTYGQTKDRINYATARYVALADAPNAPTDEALMMAAPGETRRSTITAPTPTNAFAPPPKVLEPTEARSAPIIRPASDVPVFSADAGASTGAAATVPASLPASICVDGCGGTFQKCNGACDSDGGVAKATSCQACLKTYRTCMRDCFK
jgi:hypothetical protein